jgi:hypothetical protein
MLGDAAPRAARTPEGRTMTTKNASTVNDVSPACAPGAAGAANVPDAQPGGKKRRKAPRPSADLGLVTADELREQLGISIRFVRRATRDGDLPCIVLGGRRMYHLEKTKKVIQHLAGFSLRGSRII